jgi:indolepyruvate ferredoxin oxidoreductase
MRRLERRLMAEHIELIERCTSQLSAGNYESAVNLAEAAEVVRGFEAVKLRNVDRYRSLVADAIVALR